MTLTTLVDIGVIAVPLMYGIAVVLYGWDFFYGSDVAERSKTHILAATATFHLLYIVVRTVAFDHPPITTVYEIMTLLAACIAVTYWYIEFRTKSSNTGFFILSLAFVFQVTSSFYIRDLTEIAEILRSRLLGFHVSSALLGYTAICLSAVYGSLYLMLYHEIKSSRFGVVYKRLPNLEMLEKMSHKSEVFGFWMLSAAIAIGFFWLPRAFDTFSYFDPKLVGTMLIWLIYAIALIAKKSLGWQGRRTMILSIIGFGFVFLSMTLINLYMSGFHSFR